MGRPKDGFDIYAGLHPPIYGHTQHCQPWTALLDGDTNTSALADPGGGGAFRDMTFRQRH